MSATMIGRHYLDPGDRLSGRHDPPLLVVVLVRWGRAQASPARWCGGPALNRAAGRGTCLSSAWTAPARWCRSCAGCGGSTGDPHLVCTGRDCPEPARRDPAGGVLSAVVVGLDESRVSLALSRSSRPGCDRATTHRDLLRRAFPVSRTRNGRNSPHGAQEGGPALEGRSPSCQLQAPDAAARGDARACEGERDDSHRPRGRAVGRGDRDALPVSGGAAAEQGLVTQARRPRRDRLVKLASSRVAARLDAGRPG